MNALLTIVILYGLLLIGGGIQAYLASDSMASLAAGGGLGALALAGAALAKSKPRIGFVIAGIVAFLVLGRFGVAVLKTHQIWPAGVFAVASILVLISLAAGHFLIKIPSEPAGTAAPSESETE